MRRTGREVGRCVTRTVSRLRGTGLVLEDCLGGWDRSARVWGGFGPAVGWERSFRTVSGLYGLDGLHEPRDFDRLAKEVAERCDELAQRLKATPPSARSVYALDEISNEICSVVDVAEVCRHTHPSKEYVQAAERAYVRLQDYVASLNADEGLYNALSEARRVDGKSLSQEGARVALTLQEDFERGGIHLQGAEKKAFESRLSRSLELGMEFQRNLVRPEYFSEVELDEPVVASLPRDLRMDFRNNDITTQKWRGIIDPSTSTSMLRCVADSPSRREIFVAANTGPEPNKVVLSSLINARRDVAESLGFKTYAQFASAPLLAKTPKAVKEFLLTLSEDLKQTAAEQYETLRRYSPHFGRIPSWDKAFAMSQARGYECNLNSAVLSQYFPLDTVVAGIGELLSRVLGLHIEFQDLLPGEGWTSDLKKLIVKNEDGEMRGTIYLDLVPRPGKFNHAAHFVIRCSRMLSATERQHPSVALVCNFPPSSGSNRTLLSHGEVETLLHEFGHAMHSVLSDTEFQHLSGTRAPMDIVEVPSHVFEHFAWDPSALKLLGRHHSTGDHIPDDLISALRKSKEIFSALELQQQLVFALTDLELHNQQRDLSAKAIADLAASIQNEHCMFETVPNTNWELRFGHFVGYGATYYSYLFADILAESIWKRHFAGDSLAFGAGKVLRDKLLRHGGSKDPEKLVRGVLGDDSLTEVGGGFRPTRFL